MMKEEILRDLEELLNFPQIERILYHKIEELKFYLEDEIAHYKKLRGYFKKKTYKELKIFDIGDENLEDDTSSTFLFELTKKKNGSWYVDKVEPTLPVGYDFNDIIPEEIVGYITGYDATRGKIESIADLLLPGIKGIRFDVEFAKYSDYHIIGIIRAEETEKKEIDMVSQSQAEIYNCDAKNFIEGDFYDEFFYYMKKYPPLRVYFLTEFYMRLKPLITRKLIKITATSQPVDLF
jgi:hypothetical protein